MGQREGRRQRQVVQFGAGARGGTRDGLGRRLLSVRQLRREVGLGVHGEAGPEGGAHVVVPRLGFDGRN